MDEPEQINGNMIDAHQMRESVLELGRHNPASFFNETFHDIDLGTPARLETLRIMQDYPCGKTPSWYPLSLGGLCERRAVGASNQDLFTTIVHDILRHHRVPNALLINRGRPANPIRKSTFQFLWDLRSSRWRLTPSNTTPKYISACAQCVYHWRVSDLDI